MALPWLASSSLVGCALLGACTSFATMRSAEVLPGPSITLQASGSTPPGDEAAWFWSFECAVQCDHVMASGDVSFARGFAPASGGRAYALALGLSGIYPYVDGYVQLSRSPRKPYGLGARIGIPVSGWNEYTVYARLDRPVAARQRVILNSAVFYHTGNSPNGDNPGSFLAWVQGIGLLLEGEEVSFIPAVSLVVGGGERRSSSEQIGSFGTVFAIASATVTFHRRRATP